MKSKKHVSLVTCMLLILISSCGSNQQDIQPTAVWRPAKTMHTIDPNSHLRLLWERSIYTLSDDFGNACAAMNGSLYIIASEQSEGNIKIIAIGSKDGKTKWLKESDTVFTNSNTQLFIGDGKYVLSLSPVNGNTNWTTFLLQARNVGELFYFEDKIFVNSSGYPFFVISPEDGKVITKYSSVEGFRGDYPNVPFYPDLSYETIVIDGDAILHLGKIVYSLVRENMITHDTVWEIESDLISNSTLINDTLFYISKDDRLKAINASTGEFLFETLIKPSIEFFNLERDSSHDGYYLCGDDKNRILFVILGDSRQLFAFQTS